MKPGVRRLAVHVEDHPLPYAKFEGNIPEGNYGAGSVIVWDRGTYRNLLEEKTGKGRRTMVQAIKDGKLEIWLEGEKLHGGFALVRMEDSDDQWLLMKMKDDEALSSGEKEPVDSQPRSVISKRTVEEVAKDGSTKKGHGKKEAS
jgi:DNA ligase D-like protein (predicted 3'-phosphoesterase)